MIVNSMDDVFVGCRVQLNDGRVGEVIDELDEDMVLVELDGDDFDGDPEQIEVLVGEPMFQPDVKVWIFQKLLSGYVHDDCGSKVLVEFE